MQQEETNKYKLGQVLLVDKPLEWTSFDVVRKINRLLKGVKVGHAGTLDPLATGLLIVCTGKFTKKINEYMAAEKEYTGTITLGAVTPTYDLESEPTGFKSFDQISAGDLLAAASHFTGTILQTPPIHSAIKKDGKRAYELARKGQEVVLEPRRIQIRAFEFTRVHLPVLDFRVVCSTGTYIRSLAQDVGQFLGCGAYLSSLRRTRIGEYSVEQALSMDEVIAQIQQYQAVQNG